MNTYTKAVICFILIFSFLFSFDCSRQIPGNFQGFITIPSTNSIYPPQPQSNIVLHSGIIARITVIRIEDDNEQIHGIPRVKVFFRITDNYNQAYTSSEEYSIWFTGNSHYQVYGQPLPNSGEEYLLYNLSLPEDVSVTMTASYWFKIIKEDLTEYVYPYLLDISAYRCAEKSEDMYIYTENENADILRYLLKNDLESPKFRFCASLSEFVAERIENAK